ncbi:MAG: flagellar basal body rod C-terminal domain-containing protein [Pseudomonadota bacterium]
MADAMTIAASGLQAAGQAMSALAADVVNANRLGPQIAAPATPVAAGQGVIAAPNLDMATLIVSQMEAGNAFRANLAVYRTASRMYRSLLRL